MQQPIVQTRPACFRAPVCCSSALFELHAAYQKLHLCRNIPAFIRPFTFRRKHTHQRPAKPNPLTTIVESGKT